MFKKIIKLRKISSFNWCTPFPVLIGPDVIWKNLSRPLYQVHFTMIHTNSRHKTNNQWQRHDVTNPPVTDGFPSQRIIDAEGDSTSWRPSWCIPGAYIANQKDNVTWWHSLHVLRSQLWWLHGWCQAGWYASHGLPGRPTSLCVPVNTLRPRQNGHHFADDNFKCNLLN